MDRGGEGSDHAKQQACSFTMQPLLIEKLPNKSLQIALQNIIFVKAIAEVSSGCSNGKIKMKAEDKHQALWDALQRQAEILVKVSHVNCFIIHVHPVIRGTGNR